MLRKLLFYICLLSSFLSCEFEPYGDYYKEVDPNTEVPNLNVELNIENDTIVIDQPEKITFFFKSNNKQIQWVRVLINGNECGIFEQNYGEFWINSHCFNYSPGIYSLTLEAFTNSGTGSIADHLQVEGFLFSKTWKLIIKDDLNYSMNVNSIVNENNSVWISWDKYYGLNFKNYVVFKSSDTVAVINEQEQNFVFDSAYVGEEVYYHVKVNTTTGKEYVVNGMGFEDTLPQVYVHKVENNKMTLAWDKSKYINNVAGYELYIRIPGSQNYSLLEYIENAKDTSIVLENLWFGTENDFILVTMPKKLPSYLSDFWSKRFKLGTITTGLIGESYNWKEIQTPFGDYMYYLHGDTITEYNFINEEITSNIKLQGDVSYSTKFYVSSNRKYIIVYLNNEEFIIYNIDKKLQTKHLIKDFSDESYMGGRPAISDNGIFVSGLANNGLLVYDFENNKVLYEGKLKNHSSWNEISSNGKYLYKMDLGRLYEIGFDTIIDISNDIEGIESYSFIKFVPNQPENVAYQNGDYLFTLNLSTLEVVSSCFVPNTDVYRVDYNSNKILGGSDDKLCIFDLESGQLLWEYPTILSWTFRMWMDFCNDIIYKRGDNLMLKAEY